MTAPAEPFEMHGATIQVQLLRDVYDARGPESCQGDDDEDIVVTIDGEWQIYRVSHSPAGRHPASDGMQPAADASPQVQGAWREIRRRADALVAASRRRARQPLSAALTERLRHDAQRDRNAARGRGRLTDAQVARWQR